MMGMSGILDNFAWQQFARDENGRVVFLPRGLRRQGYYVGVPDESRFKSLVKIYGLAAVLINLVGSTASIAFSQALALGERSAPLASKLRLGLIVYAISALVLYIGPALLLWSVYRRELAGLCSSLDPVDPAAVRLTATPTSARRTGVILIVAGLLILALGIFAAVSFRC